MPILVYNNPNQHTTNIIRPSTNRHTTKMEPTYKIYRVVNDENDSVYIGATQMDLAARWVRHLSHSDRIRRGLRVSQVTVHLLIGLRGARIELIRELPPGSTRADMHRLEGETIREYGDRAVNATINVGTPDVTCACGRQVSSKALYKHIRTTLHATRMLALADIRAIDEQDNDVHIDEE